MVLQRGVSDFYRTYAHHIEKKKIILFNPKEYFDKEKYNPTINKGVDENDKK